MEDSSVLFNLNEIMRLERDRVDAEAAAVRAAEANAQAEREARAREARERVLREQAAAEECVRERERMALELAREQEAQRAATLLRVKLEAEAKQRLEQQELELLHAQRLHEVAVEQRSKRTQFGIATALIAVCLGAGATYNYVLEPALRAAHDRSSALDQLTAEAAAQTQALTRQMQELAELRAQSAATTSTPSLTPSQVNAGSGTKTARPTKRVPAVKAGAQAKPDTSLDTLDRNNDDPLWGLGSDSAPKRKRR